MPFIDPEYGYLTVINLFKTDTDAKRERLVQEMRAIVDTAAFPGWISSTVHKGQDRLGTANFIQWRSREDLESRYDGNVFRHSTMPVFLEIITSARLMQTEVAFAGRHPALGEVTEISPDRDDYTVLEIFDAKPGDQSALVTAVSSAHEWLLDTPGYRSLSVLRGFRDRAPVGDTDGSLKVLSADDSFVVAYSQWDSKESFDTYLRQPEDQRHAARRATEAQRDSLMVAHDWNTYRVVHTRSATQPSAA